MRVTETIVRLTAALKMAGAPKEMVRNASEGYYDDFQSPLAAPLSCLVEDCRKYGLRNLAIQAMHGEFDATKEEAEAWLHSSDGEEALRKLNI